MGRTEGQGFMTSARDASLQPARHGYHSIVAPCASLGGPCLVGDWEPGRIAGCLGAWYDCGLGRD